MGWSIHIRRSRENKAVFIKKIKTIIIGLAFGLSRKNIKAKSTLTLLGRVGLFICYSLGWLVLELKD